jgi:lantibiotic modifying enzyme
MHIARKRVMMLRRENRPSLPDAEIKVQDYGDAIVGGFTAIYETLLQHREELISRSGPLAQFATIGCGPCFVPRKFTTFY